MTPKREIGVIAYGTSHCAVEESQDQLARESSVKTGYLRLRAYPFTEDLSAFIDRYKRIYIVEQNRDAQMKSLMRLELTPNRSRSCGVSSTIAACRSTRARLRMTSSCKKD